MPAETSGFLRDPEQLGELDAGYSIGLAQQKVNGDRPDAQRKLAVLHEAPGAEREVLPAGTATIRHGLGMGHVVNAADRLAAEATPFAFRPSQLLEPALSCWLVGESLEQLYKAHT